MNTDMPILTARQAWYCWSAVKAKDERSLTFVKMIPKSQQPKYEKGIGTIINSLPKLYQQYGNFCWGYDYQTKNSREWELRRITLSRKLLEKVLEADRKEAWKKKASALSIYAVEQAWHSSPPDMSADRKYQLPRDVLARAAKVSVSQFQRDAGDSWGFLLNIISIWEREALRELGAWVEEKRAA